MTILKDKRDLVRLRTSLLVGYKFVGEDVKRSPVVLLGSDIAEGGIRLPLPKKRPKGTRIQLSIYLPSARRPILARGEIMWVQEKKTEKGTFFETGIGFTQIKAEDKQKILSFVCNPFEAAYKEW